MTRRMVAEDGRRDYALERRERELKRSEPQQMGVGPLLRSIEGGRG